MDDGELDDFTIDGDQPSSQNANPPNPAPKKSSLPSIKIPWWGWLVIVVGALLLVGAAITIPVLLTRKTDPIPSASTQPTVTFFPTAPTFVTIDPSLIQFRANIPASDGLTKSEYQTCEIKSPQLSFLAVGRNNVSAYYVLDTTAKTVSNPSTLGITSNANVFQPNLIVTATSDSKWSNCETDMKTASTTCSTITWPSPTVNTSIFSENSTALYSVNVNANLVVQTPTKIICTGSSSLPVANSIATFSSTSNVFGIVTQSNIYLSDNACKTFQVLNFNDVIVDATMTDNAKYILVLTLARLVMLAENNNNFAIVDTMLLPDDVNFNHCAFDVFYTTTSLWCQLSTDASYSIILPFSTSSNQFQTANGYKVPVLANTLIDTNGPCAVLSFANSILNIIQSDTVGLAVVVNIKF